jgi:hypothetical protein
MKSISFAKALTLGCVMSLAALPLACGDDDDDTGNTGGSGNNAGAGGEGTPGGAGEGGGGSTQMLPPGLSATPTTTTCGGETCSSSPLLGGQLHVKPCCAAGDACGLATDFIGGFEESCQALDQPAVADDESCPESEGVSIPYNGASIPLMALPGCCRADTGTCGFVLDEVTAAVLGQLGDFGLGCVDAAPFLPDGETAAACGSDGGGGAGGAGGAGGGAGGAPEVVGGGGAGGAGGAP